MALVTTKHREQMEGLRSAAKGGLPPHIAAFILANLELVELHEGGFGGMGLDSRKAIQSHLDTLTDLVDVWVNAGNKGRPKAKKKGT